VLKGVCDVPADDLLLNDRDRGARADAREWLLDYLGDEWHRVGDVQAAAIKAGHSWRTLQRVRANECKTAKEANVNHGPWWIALSSTTAPISEQGSGALGALGADDAPNDANTANTARDQFRNGRPWSPLEDRQERQGGQERQAFDLEAYRRHRDAILGERDDDE